MPIDLRADTVVRLQSAARDHAFTPSQKPSADRGERFHASLDGVLHLLMQGAQIFAAAFVAFAMSAGWWSGVAVFMGIGCAIGLVFRQREFYWTLQMSEWLLLIIGGLIIGLVAP